MYGFESACQLFEFARRVSSNSETCFSSFSMDNIFSDDLLIFITKPFPIWTGISYCRFPQQPFQKLINIRTLK